MNHPAATYLAESKPYQLSLAAVCGFQVPPTLATNDAHRIRQSFPQSVVIKALDTVLLHEGDDCLFAYATVHSATELRDDAVAPAPLFAQRVLHPKRDIRVTLVGDDLFAVRILSRGAGVAGDWRLAPRADLEYQDLLLDEGIADCCRQMARRLHLSFAAIDLIETADGIFFIEVNPTGEWGWLSTAARPIDQAIASWLATPKRRA